MADPALVARGVWFAYHDRWVIEDLDLSLAEGEFVGLVGPNGSGKSTLLKVLSGLLPPDRGTVHLEGVAMRRLRRREVARRVAVVPQELAIPFGLCAREMVMLGRTPHVRPLRGARPVDRRVVEEKMALTGTLDLADRPYNELSGGEQQRVALAMALSQEARILLLDEPTVHLDINHQVEMLELLRRLNREHRQTVLLILHDLNLAALYVDRLLLLHGGRIVADGAPGEVLDEHRIREVFGAHVLVQPHPTHPSPQVVILPPSGPDDAGEPANGRTGRARLPHPERPTGAR